MQARSPNERTTVQDLSNQQDFDEGMRDRYINVTDDSNSENGDSLGRKATDGLEDSSSQILGGKGEFKKLRPKNTI